MVHRFPTFGETIATLFVIRSSDILKKRISRFELLVDHTVPRMQPCAARSHGWTSGLEPNYTTGGRQKVVVLGALPWQ
ncbi:MAG: hypothetical protein NVSMB42_10820 [Herpetosiphon sp.]